MNKRKHRSPPPDLAELIAKYGSYSNITAQGWVQYDIALAEWRDRVRYDEAEKDREARSMKGESHKNR
jgi:hypothetical protein